MGTFKAMSQKKLKILQVASGDCWGGAEAQVLALCNQLNKNPQIDLTVVLLNHGELSEKLKLAHIKTFIIDESCINAFAIFFQIKQLIKKINPNIVHTHREKENILGSIAAYCNNTLSIRSVHGAPEHHANWLKPHKKIIPVLNKLCGKLIQKKIVSVSVELEQKLLKDYSANKLTTIENGIELAALDRLKSNHKREISQKINIGIVGRLVPVKRVDRFINAAKLLYNRLKSHSLQFHILGDGPLKEELQQQSSDYIKSFTFHGHRTDIHQKIIDLDILVMTSDHEGLPMTLLESMYLQTPVVCSAVGAIPEVLANGKYGTLVHTLTAENFAQSLQEVILAKEKTQQKTKFAVEAIKKQYSSSTNANEFINLYQQIINSFLVKHHQEIAK